VCNPIVKFLIQAKMKKVYYILFTVFLTLGIQSCTPTPIVDDAVVPQACCGDDGQIPPPPGGGFGNGGG